MVKQRVTLGIDLGGTKTDIGIVDPSGKILRREVIKTSKNGPQTVVNEIKDVVAKLASQEETIVAAGVGMAGQIDGNTFIPGCRVHILDAFAGRKNTGIADNDIQPAKTPYRGLNNGDNVFVLSHIANNA